MALLKVDSERYPRCLWHSVTGSLIGAFQFGYGVAVLNTALPHIAKDLHYHKDAVLSSAVVLGAAIGAILAGKAADRLGPRHAQVVNCSAFMLGALLSGGAPSHKTFLVGRFVSGFGAGSASLYVPRYIAEVSPPELRGWLGSLNQVLINSGILVAYCAGVPYEQGFTGFDVFGGNVWVSWWRTMTALAVLPAVLQILVLSGCPESPVWLEGRGLRDAADDACIRLWGARALLADPDYEADAAQAADLVSSASMGLGTAACFAGHPNQSTISTPLLQHNSYQQSNNRTAAGEISVRHCTTGSRYNNNYHRTRLQEPSGAFDGGVGSLHRGSAGVGSSLEGRCEGLASTAYAGWQGLLARRYRLMMMLAVGLPLLQQASGINTVVYYSSKLFATAGLKSPIAASIITGGINLGVTLAAAALLDRYGRKPLLLISHTGMAVALGAVAAVALATVPSPASGLLMVVLVLLYVACFAVGSGPVTWVVLSEVLPPQIKGPAASLATAAAWTGNLVVTLSFDSLLQQLGLSGTYLMYGLCNLGAALFVGQLLVETRCRSLQEIEEMLLLPDMDPRLAALLPALQQQQQQGDSSNAGGSPSAAAVHRAPPPYRPAAAEGHLSLGRGYTASPRHYQQQQWLLQQQAAVRPVGAMWSSRPAAVDGSSTARLFFGFGRPPATSACGGGGAAAAPLNSSGSICWPGGGRWQLTAPSPSAAHTSTHLDVRHDDFDLPSALPAEMESSQEEVFISKQHYVAGWAVSAAADASMHNSEATLPEDEAASDPAARSDSYVSEPQQHSPELQPHEKRAALMQRYGSKEGSSIATAAADAAPVVVKGFVVQQNTLAVAGVADGSEPQIGHKS